MGYYVMRQGVLMPGRITLVNVKSVASFSSLQINFKTVVAIHVKWPIIILAVTVRSVTLMTKVDNYGGYDFYIQAARGDRPALYNIVPQKSLAPEGGYRNRQYIEKIKGIKFPDRYQPTLHGMSELYLYTEEPKD
jgi:hypothetical protein